MPGFAKISSLLSATLNICVSPSTPSNTGSQPEASSQTESTSPAEPATQPVSSEVSAQETEVEPNVYFVYAEKVEEADDVVTFATVNLKDNRFYTWVNEYGNDYPDVPYMLTMDSKGTATLEDDEILVVWANN